MHVIDPAAMLADLESLVNCESKTGDLEAITTCAELLRSIGDRLLGPYARSHVFETSSGPVVQWNFGAGTPTVALVGHYDTVHPRGTIDNFPFSVEGDIIRGPGTYDMKCGLLVALYGCAEVIRNGDPATLDGAVIFCNPDEEDGSKASSSLLQRMAAEGLHTALAFEGGGENSEVRTRRKGGMWLDVRFEGSDAHGSRPWEGANALAAMGEYIARLPDLQDDALGTTVVPTMASSGKVINTAPGDSRLVVDVRTFTDIEQQRVYEALTRPVDTPGITLRHSVIHRFGAMSDEASRTLLKRVNAIAASAGHPTLVGSTGSGITDANHLASFGVDVVDGLGPAGGNDHSPDEWASVSAMVSRARLISQVVPGLLAQEVTAEAAAS